MPYLIDGHNLVPHIPGLRLDAADDEQQLIELLQEFCRVGRKQVEVYFDNAPPGQAGSRRFGQVGVHFVRAGRSADEAIRDRLRRLGRSARNWTVVSSDLRVQEWARQSQARFQSSDEFSRLLRAALSGENLERARRPDAQPDQAEVDYWLQEFEEHARRKKRNKGE